MYVFIYIDIAGMEGFVDGFSRPGATAALKLRLLKKITLATFTTKRQGGATRTRTRISFMLSDQILYYFF